MNNMDVNEPLLDNPSWLRKFVHFFERYSEFCRPTVSTRSQAETSIFDIFQFRRNQPQTIAFVAESSRGKSELINALIFAETGLRLLPSAPGRTTMSPTELFWDSKGGSYIRLLDIEIPLDHTSLDNYKRLPACWTQIKLDTNSPSQMQEAFKFLRATKLVSVETAAKLGFYPDVTVAFDANGQSELVEIPCWRHALVSFPHPLLKNGLRILDTPGLNTLGNEHDLTKNILPIAQVVIFILAADVGVTKSDLKMWNSYLSQVAGQQRKTLAVVMNKIDSLWDDLIENYDPEIVIQNQITAIAAALNINQSQVFAISAKQSLLAKVRGDKVLLDKSGLINFEKFLVTHLHR